MVHQQMLAGIVIFLAACNGGSSSGSTGQGDVGGAPAGGPDAGSIRLDAGSDAPADAASAEAGLQCPNLPNPCDRIQYTIGDPVAGMYDIGCASLVNVAAVECVLQQIVAQQVFQFGVSTMSASCFNTYSTDDSTYYVVDPQHAFYWDASLITKNPPGPPGEPGGSSSGSGTSDLMTLQAPSYFDTCLQVANTNAPDAGPNAFVTLNIADQVMACLLDPFVGPAGEPAFCPK